MRKTAAVFGASGVLGGAIVRALAADYNVAAFCYRSADTAGALAKELNDSGQAVRVFTCDIRSGIAVQQSAAQAAEAFGPADVLVNCAGVALYGLITDAGDTDFTDLFDVNVRGVFHTCSAFLPAMIARKQGAIVNISSVWGIGGASCEVLYSASKAAVIGLTKALAKEVAPSGVTVNCVAPGFVDSPMNSTLTEAERAAFLETVPLGRAGTPEEVAQTVRMVLDNRYLTGQIISPNGGMI